MTSAYSSFPSPLLYHFHFHFYFTHLTPHLHHPSITPPSPSVTQRGSPVGHRPVFRLRTNGSFLPSQPVYQTAQSVFGPPLVRWPCFFCLSHFLPFPSHRHLVVTQHLIRVPLPAPHAGRHHASSPFPIPATPAGLAPCAMPKSTHTDPRHSLDALDSPVLSSPLSPLSLNTSAPASPAISLFSAAAHGHNRVSSSVSSLVSSTGLGNSIDNPSRSHLTGVKEEESTRDSLEDSYFRTSSSLLPQITYDSN